MFLEMKLNNIDEYLDEVQKITSPLKEMSQAFNSMLSPEFIELQSKINSIVPPEILEFTKQFGGILEPIQTYIAKFNVVFKDYFDNLQKWQEKNEVYVTDLVEQGWYPTPHSFYSKPQSGDTQLDTCMQNEIIDNWDELTSEILSSNPNRKHILEAAFKLHSEGNYIASIPLFFSQADGICCEHFKSFIFTRNCVNEKLEYLKEIGEIKSGSMTEMLLLPYKLKNHHKAGISANKSSKKAPNRNGILHGHRKHLSYGTLTNSLKAFSLLCFVVMSTNMLVDNKT